MARGSKTIRVCKCCKKEFEARIADVNRGWAKFCSKSCKAIKQEQNTGQMKNYLAKKESRKWIAYYPDDHFGEYHKPLTGEDFCEESVREDK